VSIINSDFGSMHAGSVVTMSGMLIVKDCNYDDNLIGLLSSASIGVVCTSVFTDNEFSSVVFEKSDMYFFDNQFTGTVDGSASWTGGRIHYRNNDFGTYVYGINAIGTTSILRDIVNDTQDYEFGRNDFLSPTDQYSFKGRPALAVSDIYRGPQSVLYVSCGYNDFTLNSTNHVLASAPNEPFNASYNRWAYAGGVWQPRTNAAYTGNNFDVQQDPNNNCGVVEVESNCTPIECGGIMNYSNLTESTSALYSAINTLRADIIDTTLSQNCRNAKSWELVGAVSRTDSAAVASQAKASLASVATNTALPVQLRSTAYMAKAKIHEQLDELDSARSLYTTVTSSFSSGVDSIPANWSLMLLDALQDTIGKRDSLMGVHIDRVIFDLRRPISLGGMSKASLAGDSRPISSDSSLTIESISPNPTLGDFHISVRSSIAEQARLEIINVSGNRVIERAVFLNSGQSTIVENVLGFVPGVYYVRITRGTASVVLPLSIRP